MAAAPHGAGLGAGALMGAVAVLGWWLLTQAEKEAGKVLLWSGRVVGWLLLAGGLAGFMCASLSHAAKAWKACSSCAMHGPQGGPGGLPPGHPPLQTP
ncbi:hypothetical protein EPO15_13165 [bacterium]|nr:MAG: hypothetical protein EPO15_13165 [bacterium]